MLITEDWREGWSNLVISERSRIGCCNSKSFHYFRYGVSLCGKFKGTSSFFVNEQDANPKCKECLKRL